MADFFICNFYSFKIVYNKHIIYSMLEEFSLSVYLLIQAMHLYSQFHKKRKFPFTSLRSKPGHSFQEASGITFSHHTLYLKCQFDVNLCPVWLPSQYACFKIHVRIKLLPIFLQKMASNYPSIVPVLIICTVFKQLTNWQAPSFQLLQLPFALEKYTFHIEKTIRHNANSDLYLQVCVIWIICWMFKFACYWQIMVIH